MTIMYGVWIKSVFYKNEKLMKFHDFMSYTQISINIEIKWHIKVKIQNNISYQFETTESTSKQL